MRVQSSFVFWGIALGAAMAILIFLKGVLLPFIAGLAVAYLLNPVVEKLSAWHLNRVAATSLILIGFLVLMVAVMAVVVPMIIHEMTTLAAMMPDILSRVQAVIVQHVPVAGQAIAHLKADHITLLIQDHLAQAMKFSAGFAASLLTGGQTALSILMFVALMPIVAFYMMTQWPYLLNVMDDLLPRPHVDTIRDLIKKIDIRIAGFIRGQLIVCTLLAVYYAIALSAVGLQYGGLIGILTGILSIIPFVGSIFGLGSAVIISLFQMPVDGWGVLIAALVVFAVGQFVEGNFITPKIVGDRVGLHPLWIIFALLSGGSLMGLFGMFIAVPVAAFLAVLIIFGIDRYKQSVYYTGVKSVTASSTSLS